MPLATSFGSVSPTTSQWLVSLWTASFAISRSSAAGRLGIGGVPRGLPLSESRRGRPLHRVLPRSRWAGGGTGLGGCGRAVRSRRPTRPVWDRPSRDVQRVPDGTGRVGDRGRPASAGSTGHEGLLRRTEPVRRSRLFRDLGTAGLTGTASLTTNAADGYCAFYPELRGDRGPVRHWIQWIRVEPMPVVVSGPRSRDERGIVRDATPSGPPA